MPDYLMIPHQQKLKLYQLTSLVKSLYPGHRTENRFYEKTDQLTHQFCATDKLLFHDLLHCLTLLSCPNLTRNILPSNETDLLNTAKLMLPKSLQLTERHLDIYEQLYEIYQTELFTYIEACSRLKVSQKTFKRYLEALQYHQLVRKHAHLSRRVLLEVIPDATNAPTAFEIMNEEWKEYKGFVEL
jgi:hypothetical protein